MNRLAVVLLPCALLLAMGAPPASAEDVTGHYHPDDIAAASKVFANAAQSVGPRYATAAQSLKKVSAGLAYLEIGALTMGSRSPEGLDAWMAEVRRQATGEFIRLQRHVDLMGEDYGTEFGAAMARVLAKEDKGLVECGATGIAAMVGGKNCPSDDVNARIAAAIDKDAVLKKAVASIDAIPWPEVSEPSRTWPVVPLLGSSNWVQAGALLKKLFPARLQKHQDDLDRGLADLEEAIAAGDADALETAKRHRASYEAALAADGDILFAAMAEALEKGAKKGAPTDVGLCANAPSIGGCEGTDVTREVLRFLSEDKRFIKATAALRGD